MMLTCVFLLLPLSIGLCILTAGLQRASMIASVLIWLAGVICAYIQHLIFHPEVDLFGLVSSILVYTNFISTALGIEIIGALVVGFLWFGRLKFVSKPFPRSWRTWLFAVCTGVLGLLAAIIFFAARWGYQTFGHISANQLSFMLNHDLSNSATEINLTIIWAVIIPTIIATIAAFAIGLSHKNLLIRTSNRTRSTYTYRHLNLAYLCALFLALAATTAQAFYLFPIQRVIANDTESSTYIEENYVYPDKSNIHFPQQKQNLIHIYLESMENSYYSKDEGGYMTESLMPDLAQLTKEGISFSNTAHFGGPQQVPGTEHSVAAMVAMNAGVPMLTAGYRNGQRLSYPDFPTIGDLLEARGYKNVFMLGSDQNWGGLGDYYRRHGNFEVVDLQTAYDIGFVESGYKVRWGLEDEKLYQLAKEKLTELAQSKQPFYFVLENADTHFPDGYYSPRYDDPPFDEHYSNAIYYSQRDVVAFVRWIQSQPWAANTTIVLTGDHQSMDKNYFQDWDPKYNRTIVNIFLNSLQGDKISPRLSQNRIYATYDLFPTILASIGVKIDGNRLGVGTNLFSSRETLISRHGVANVIHELNLSSYFYDSHRETKAEK